LVPVAKEVFDRLMPQPNQTDRVRLHVRVLRDDLLKIHKGTKTEAGMRLNIRVGVQYIDAWLRGQWIKHGAVLEGGVKVTAEFFERALRQEMQVVKREVGAANYARGRFPEAIKLFREVSLSREFVPFLTIPAYERMLTGSFG
jgi:malate synthase